MFLKMIGVKTGCGLQYMTLHSWGAPWRAARVGKGFDISHSIVLTQCMLFLSIWRTPWPHGDITLMVYQNKQQLKHSPPNTWATWAAIGQSTSRNGPYRACIGDRINKGT
jgi:hypothetical protein